MKQNVYTVSQINHYIRNMFTQDFLCSSVLIKGELSNVKYHGSGHIYFTLKDTGAAISCVMFSKDRTGLTVRLENGLQVVVMGNIDVYERDGKYQLYARQIEAVGGGLLYELFEKTKRELEEMGMFDASYKQPIPAYTKKLGVVTASTGAAVQDIINVSKRRNPYIDILLYPAIVQGEEAEASIVKGIEALAKTDVDVIIVGRGGGSMEDLWAFNSPAVAQAVFDCPIPVISAVGHETDTTIIDYVADLRAPTPSAAAELAVCDIVGLLCQIAERKERIISLFLAKCERARMLLEQRKVKLKAASPKARLKEHQMHLTSLEDELAAMMERKLLDRKHELEVYISILSGLSPLEKMSQGYAYVQTKDKRTLTSISQVQAGETVRIFLKDGSVKADVTDLQSTEWVCEKIPMK